MQVEYEKEDGKTGLCSGGEQPADTTSKVCGGLRSLKDPSASCARSASGVSGGVPCKLGPKARCPTRRARTPRARRRNLHAVGALAPG